jgi:predicted NBD/HSP70 family sugar kinase
VLRLAGNVEGLEGRAFADELERALDVPVELENDINLAALGELWQGVAAGSPTLRFLSVGTGLGAGLVLGGELHRGRNGAAGSSTSPRRADRRRRSLRSRCFGAGFSAGEQRSPDGACAAL